MKLQGEINKSHLEMEIPLSVTESTNTQEISEDTEDLSSTIYKLNLIGTYRTFYPGTAECGFCSRAHGTFTKADGILGYAQEISKILNTFKSYIVCSAGHMGIKLDIWKMPTYLETTYSPSI